MRNTEYSIIKVKPEQRDLIIQAANLEQKAFGIGGMNEWFLPAFIRHGVVFMAVSAEQELWAVAEYMRDFKQPTQAYLFGITVKQEQRRRGIASQLLFYAHRYLKSSGFEQVSLTVAPTNYQALSLYHQLGFEHCGDHPNEYGVGEDRQSLVLKF